MEKALDQAEKANIPECIMSFITCNLMMWFFNVFGFNVHE